MNIWQKTASGFVIVGMAASISGQKLDRYEEPIVGPHEVIIENMGPADKYAYKADVLAGVDIGNLDDDPQNEFFVDNVEIEVFVLKREGDLLYVDMRAYQNGESLKVDNPYYFKNPPIKVPSGKYRVELVDGVEKDVQNAVENPSEALKTILYQVVKQQNGL